MKLSQFIKANLDSIVADWEDFAGTLPAGKSMTTLALRDHSREILMSIAAEMDQREQAEERTDNDFARRLALLTESLNSTAIDVDKILSTDVSDTAWSAYLRGDRGVFTRRAVRLIDNGGARDIAARIAYGSADLDDACAAMLAEVAHQRGDGGVIAIDRSGAVTMAFNSPVMKRAVAGAGRQPFVGIR